MSHPDNVDLIRHLRRLRTQGFAPSRPGKIHMRCPGCGRKQSNMDRHAEHDHPTAYLMEISCDKCGAGCKDECPTYYTRQGRAIDYWRWWDKRERSRHAGEGVRSDGT